MPPAVTITGLTRRFGGAPAVDDVTLHVDEHEVFGIVGPDGAGKSTLMRLAVGVLAPDAGSVTVAGHDVHRQRNTARLKLGYMSQTFSLYRDLSVQENIWFFATLRGVRRADRLARAQRLLEATGLAPFTDRLAGNLSGGMKQKLGLICTLVHEPEVLFLDEPTNGVDPVSRREFWEILGELRQRVAVVVSTPALDEAERCDRVALLEGGRLLAVDTPDGLRGRVVDPVWEVSLDAPFEAAAVLGEALPDARVQLFGDRLHVVSTAPPDTLRQLLAAAGHAADIARITPSLEDAYVQLVGAP